MMTMTVRDLLDIPRVRGYNLDGVLQRRIRAVGTDSRTVKKNDVFVAFRGSRVDAHDLVPAICRGGILACVVERRWFNANRDAVAALPLIVVTNTVRAYGDIARLYRAGYDIPLVAVTGSNGKTSTKEMIAAVLRTKYNVLQTEGNYNNQIGLPATLLRLRPGHEVIVTEMGTNQPGDIPYLCSIAHPTHSLVTNIGRAHIQKLLSREGIAEEKCAVYSSLPDGGIAIVNNDEALLRQCAGRRKGRITYGSKGRPLVKILQVELDTRGRPSLRIEAPGFTSLPVVLRLQSPGRHSAWNAAAAMAVGFAFGCGPRKMKQALEALGSYDRRLQVLDAGGVTILDDSYNANPDSVLAAVDLLQNIRVEGVRFVVLGDMLELGRGARAEHGETGRNIATAGVQYLLTCGTLSSSAVKEVQGQMKFARHYRDRSELLRELDALVQPGDVVLVKGSRGMNMDEIVRGIVDLKTRQEAGL